MASSTPGQPSGPTSAPGRPTLVSLLPPRAGSLTAVLEALDIEKRHRSAAAETEARARAAQAARREQIQELWSLLSRGAESVPQFVAVQFVLNARGEDMPVRFFSNYVALAEWRMKRTLGASRTAQAPPQSTWTVEPALAVSEAVEERALLADRQIGLHEWEGMLSELDASQLAVLRSRYMEYLALMERESTVKTVDTGPMLMPRCLCSDGAHIYISDTDNGRILQMDLQARTLAVLFEAPAAPQPSPDAVSEAPAPEPPLCPSQPYGLCWDSRRNRLYVSDRASPVLWSLDLRTGQWDMLLDAFINAPKYLLYDAQLDCVYMSVGHSVQRVWVETRSLDCVAGDENSTGWRDGAPGHALFTDPMGLCFSRAHSALFVCDSGSHCLRRIDFQGAQPQTVSTVAGCDDAGFGDGIGPSARLRAPCALAFDNEYMLYFADAGNCAVGRFNLLNGAVTTIAGTGIAGHHDTFGPDAQFSAPTDLLYAHSFMEKLVSDGTLYVLDCGNSALRLIEPPQRPPAEGGVTGTVCAARGCVYIADTVHHQVSLLDMRTLGTAVVAGSGVRGFLDGPFTEARFDEPRGLAVDGRGFIYVADFGNHRIRKIDPIAMTVSTVAGTGLPGVGEGPALETRLDSPHSLTFEEVTGSLVFCCASTVMSLSLSTRTLRILARLPRGPVPYCS